jgi:hypothetical protein
MFFAVKLGSIVELMKKVWQLNVLWWKSLRLERLYGGIYTLWSPLQPKERPLWQCRWGPVFLHPVLISKGRLAAGYLNSHGEVRSRSTPPKFRARQLLGGRATKYCKQFSYSLENRESSWWPKVGLAPFGSTKESFDRRIEHRANRLIRSICGHMRQLSKLMSEAIRFPVRWSS